MSHEKRWVTVLVCSLVAAMTFVFAPDSMAEEGKDHPLIQRYPGSQISKSFVRDFDEVQMPTGKSERQGFADMITVKGKVTGII